MLARELALEQVRRAEFPEKISRLRGLYCFLAIEDAERAANQWSGNHFKPEFLAELHLGEADAGRDKHDANWIAQPNLSGDTHAIREYWAGEACPGHAAPIWETLVEGRAVVLGTTLRERAYEIVKANAGDTLTFLEIGRLAAWAGSDLGNICGCLVEEGDDVALHYLMDMRQAADPDLLAKMDGLIKSGHPVRWGDIQPNFANDSFGAVPDLRPFEFKRPKADLPYVGAVRRDG
jgi:hypothetical protein